MTDHPWDQPPLEDELEVVLFGPGKGECVLVHLGHGAWIVVDSCVDESGTAAPLAYLASLGVDPGSIELVLASHWHDDHVGGLSQIVESAPAARVVCSQALNTDEFVELVAAADLRPLVKATSGVHEFRRVLDLLTERAQSPTWACVDRLLVSRNDPASVRVHALSPSDASITEAFRDIDTLRQLQTMQNRLAVPRPMRNPAAVVLHVIAGEVCLLLCSDLEVDNDPGRGWTAVLDAPARPRELADLVKVAHHGSENGHDDRVWDQMMVDQPHAALTPFLSGRTPIPRPSDIARIVGLTPHAYITRPPGSPKAKRDWRAQRMAERVADWITAEPTTAGALRFRRALDGSDAWRVHASGTATRLSA